MTHKPPRYKAMIHGIAFYLQYSICSAHDTSETGPWAEGEARILIHHTAHTYK